MGMISEEDARRRRECVESALGTSAMEGLFLDAPTLALMKRFEAGEIEMDELSLAIKLHVQTMGVSPQAADTAAQTTANAA